MLKIIVAMLMVCGCDRGLSRKQPPGGVWTFALVDPLADGRLLTDVYIHGQGPFLFAIDSQSWMYMDTVLLPLRGHDTLGRGYDVTSVDDIRMGNMHFGGWAKWPGIPHLYDADGRRVVGVIGMRGLVFGFDRDRGIAWVDNRPDSRSIWGPEYFDVKINNESREMKINLGRTTSALDPDEWSDVGMATSMKPITYFDNRKGVRTFAGRGTANVTIDNVSRSVDFAGLDVHGEHLYDGEGGVYFAGEIGLDFFKPFSVEINWKHAEVSLTKRHPVMADVALRLSRWGDRIPPCANRGCAQVTLQANQVDVVPEISGTLLEVVFRATKPGVELHDLELNLQKNGGAFHAVLPPEYAGATLEVIDASPYPRSCSTASSCLLIESYDRT